MTLSKQTLLHFKEREVKVHVCGKGITLAKQSGPKTPAASQAMVDPIRMLYTPINAIVSVQAVYCGSAL